MQGLENNLSSLTFTFSINLTMVVYLNLALFTEITQECYFSVREPVTEIFNFQFDFYDMLLRAFYQLIMAFLNTSFDLLLLQDDCYIVAIVLPVTRFCFKTTFNTSRSSKLAPATFRHNKKTVHFLSHSQPGWQYYFLKSSLTLHSLSKVTVVGQKYW